VLIEVTLLDAGNWTGFQWSGYSCLMKLHPDFAAVLTCLLARARAGQRTSVAALGRALGASLGDSHRRLVALDRAGLVDAGRVRLTLAGLAVAVSLGASRASLAA
jgi:hypothetical protein